MFPAKRLTDYAGLHGSVGSPRSGNAVALYGKRHKGLSYYPLSEGVVDGSPGNRSQWSVYTGAAISRIFL